MNRRVARAVAACAAWVTPRLVRVAARLTPRDMRERWREEWLAELAAQPSLRRALGAPWDAATVRVAALRDTARMLVNGCRGDARHTLRTLVAAPGHAVAVVICLGVGMVVSITVFSVVVALLYGDVPGIADRRSLARLFISYKSTASTAPTGSEPLPATALAMSDFDVVAAVPNPLVTSFAAEGDTRLGLSIGDRSVGTTAVFVSANYFATLGTAAERGRLLTEADDRATALPVAVLGYHLWRERFDGRDDIIGLTTTIAGRALVIVGVAPPRFTGIQPIDVGAAPLDGVQLWLPLHLARNWPGLPDANTAWLDVVARLAPGATRDAAQASMLPAAVQIARSQPDARARTALIARPHGFGPNDSSVQVLMVVALVLSVPLSILAIACANVANLQLARATRKSREIAIRLALGATRAQVMRLLTFEALALTLVAAIAGLLGTRLLLAMVDGMFPMIIVVDRRVIVFALLISAGATMLSGLAPAWLVAHRGNATELRQSAQSGGVQHGRLRSALVVLQIALSLALLTVCGLFTQSSRAVIRALPPAMHEIVRADLDVRGVNGNSADAARLQRDVLARVAADGRVRAAAIESRTGFRYRDAASGAREEHVAGSSVTVDWVDAAGARLVAGRAFTPADRDDVALVTDRLAQQLAGDTSAIGRTIHVRRGGSDGPAAAAVTIVGVIARLPIGPTDVHPDPAIYLPLMDAPLATSLVVRTIQPDAIVAEVRAIVAATDARLSWVPVERADAAYLRDTDPITYLAISMAGFGAVALALAAGGLFAMMAYVVSLRTRELGIRVALGADAGDVVALVVRQAATLAAFGAVAGLALAVPTAFVLRGLFIGVSPADPLALAPAIGLMFVVALAAAMIPARRAVRVDPVSVLRDS